MQNESDLICDEFLEQLIFNSSDWLNNINRLFM